MNIKISILSILTVAFAQGYLFAQDSTNIDSLRLIVMENLLDIQGKCTSKTKDKVEKLLVGKWTFMEGSLPKDLPISKSTDINLYSQKLVDSEVKRNRPKDFLITDDKTYQYDNPDKFESKGTLEYDDSTKHLVLFYDRPVYTIDSSMAIMMGMKPLTKTELRIYSVDKNQLVIMKLYPINSIESWFYLLKYEKNK